MMAPRKQAQSESAGAAQAPGDNVKKRRVSARVATSSSKKRKLVSDMPDEAGDSRVDQVKAKRPKWGRVAGRLAGLMEMPMDVLFEIFGHLMPLDVLRLARTTKQFRQLLMHRSSISVWVAARRNVSDLPDCPPYLSEPQFANLVFDTHCHECLSPNIRSIDWRIGRRICARCAKECMVEDYPLIIGGGSILKAVPSKQGKRGRPFYYVKDVQEFQLKRASFADPEERDKFVKQRQDLVLQMEKHGALLDAWAANQARDRSEQLDDLRRERKEAIIGKLTELGWGAEIEQILYRDDLSHHRLVKQPTRLTPRIWTNIRDEMVNYMEQMKAQRLERERKALIISRKIIAVSILRTYKISHLPITDVMPEPMDFCAIPQVSEIVELPTEVEVTKDTFAPVEEQMDELVGEWRAQILGSLVQKVKDLLHPHRPRMNDATDSTSMNVTINSSSAEPVGKGKARIVEPFIPSDSEIIQALSLATTVFNCKCCSPRFGIFYGFYDSDSSSDSNSTSSEDDIFDSWEFGLTPRRRLRCNPLFYPKVLGHHCLTKQLEFSSDSQNGDPTKQYEMGNRTRWSGHLLQVDERAGKMVANIVTTCGMDPKTTTVDVMDQSGHQLACLECLDWSDVEWDQADAPVFSWRAAVAHNCRTHASRTNIQWQLIDDELVRDIVDVDEEKMASQASMLSTLLQGLVPDDLYTGPPEEMVWLCVHCLDLPAEAGCMNLSRMKSHLSARHSIAEPQENQDYFKDYEVPQCRRARAPNLRITLAMDRPDNIPAPGEKGPWSFWFSDDEFEDGYYSDDYI